MHTNVSLDMHTVESTSYTHKNISCKVSALLGHEYQSQLESAVEWKGTINSHSIHTHTYSVHITTYVIDNVHLKLNTSFMGMRGVVEGLIQHEVQPSSIILWVS